MLCVHNWFCQNKCKFSRNMGNKIIILSVFYITNNKLKRRISILLNRAKYLFSTFYGCIFFMCLGINFLITWEIFKHRIIHRLKQNLGVIRMKCKWCGQLRLPSQNFWCIKMYTPFKYYYAYIYGKVFYKRKFKERIQKSNSRLKR